MIEIKTATLIAMGLAALFAVGAYVLDGIRRRRVEKRMSERPHYSDLGFAEHAFAGDAVKTALAARVQKILEKYLDITLDGLRLDDRLSDLELKLEASPDFFFELESEFKVETGIEEYDVFERLAKGLVTFADLVDYVDNLVTDSRRKKKRKFRWGWNAESILEALEGAMPFLCVGGLMLTFPGMILGIDWMVRIGTFSLLLGIALFFLSVGGALSWKLAWTYFEEGGKPFRERWFLSFVYVVWAGGFLCCGLILVWILFGALAGNIPWT